MAITYGYFNSVDGDRTYTADQMSEYFDGLVSNGVYESVGGALQVTASTGMDVNVAKGRAIINCKWLKNDAALTLSITTASSLLPRYTAVILKLDVTNRLMTITTKDGTAASTPAKPTMQKDNTVVEIPLAYIYVPAADTAITQDQIEDVRGSAECPWVTGLIKQVDTSTLFLQYQTAYENMLEQMETWQASMKSEFETWLAALTDELNVNTYIEKYEKVYTMQGTPPEPISLDMTGYTYDEDDIIQVYINGLLGVIGTDYTFDSTNHTITVNAYSMGNVIDIVVFKSQIGFSTGN